MGSQDSQPIYPMGGDGGVVHGGNCKSMWMGNLKLTFQLAPIDFELWVKLKIKQNSIFK